MEETGIPMVVLEGETAGSYLMVWDLCVRMTFVGSDATLPLEGEEPVRGIRVDRARLRVFIGGRELTPPLSPDRLLTTLLDARGQVVSREEIVRAVRPEGDATGISEQTLDALVRRERLAELDPQHEYIVTVRGHRFRLENR